MDIRLKLSPPWITYINKLKALFGGDPQITFNVDRDAPSVTLACNNGDKVAALLKLLPTDVQFGNVTLPIIIDGVPTDRAFINKQELFEVVFEKNPAFAYVVAPVDADYPWFGMIYVVFKNCVVQFFNDNLNDAHGVLSTLYQDIAYDLLTGDGADGVYFCTDVERGAVGKPLGEWP